MKSSILAHPKSHDMRRKRHGSYLDPPCPCRGTIDGVAIAIIVVLFGIQQFGTAFVGALFSPIVSIWLLANAVLGVYNIAKWHPGIFIALSPHKW